MERRSTFPSFNHQNGPGFDSAGASPMSRTIGYLSAAMLAGIAVPASAQSAGAANSIVIVTGQQPTTPIPTLMEGAAASLGNIELADQLFLRLAGLGPTMLTAGDRGFIPLLARSWTRRDS